MLEPQRSHYLRALGIDIYVPRLILPGALAVQPYSWDTDAAVDETANTATAVTGAPNAETIVVAANVAATHSIETNTVEGLVAETVVREAVVTEVVVTEAVVTETITAARQRSLPDNIRSDIIPPLLRKIDPASAETRAANNTASAAPAISAVPKIALSVVVGDGGILIVDDAPSTTAARAEYLRLLANVLFALQGRNTQPQLDVFLWPMAKHPQLDQGAAAARETLTAHIQNQIQQHAIHTVLLLGDAAQHWCEIAGDNTLHCVRSVSALACLQIPESKRQLWQDIRHMAVAR